MISSDILKKVKRIELATRRLVNEIMAGSYHSTFKGRGMEFEEVREYQPGDDVRTIDWNVTARTGIPYIKTFKEERELSVMLVVDLSGSTSFGSKEQTKGELAAELCALLAFSAIKNNDRVGLLIFTDKVEKYIPPKKGKNHVLRVIREILYFKPQNTGTNIPAAVEHLMQMLKRKSVVFLISDFISHQPIKRPLAVLNQKHDLIAMHISDKREFAIPPLGFVEFCDPETGKSLIVDTYDPVFRIAFQDKIELYNQEVSNGFKQLKIDVANITTDQSYIEPIIQLFQKRALRQ